MQYVYVISKILLETRDVVFYNFSFIHFCYKEIILKSFLWAFRKIA